MTQDPYQEETVDIKSLIFKYLRYWYWFVIAVAIALTAAYFYNKFAETVYRTSATVLIRDDRFGGAQRPGQFMGELELFSPRRNIYNEMAILKSHSLVDTTIRQMNIKTSYYNIGRIVGEIRKTEIYKNTPFKVDFKSESAPKNIPFNVKIISQEEFEIESGSNGLFAFTDNFSTNNNNQRGRFGEEIKNNGYSFTLNLTDNYNPASHNGREYIFRINSLASLVSKYRSKTSVEPLNPDVSIVNVSFEAASAERAIDFLNKLTESYIRQGLDQKNQTALNTIDFIDDQIDVTTDSLHMAESSLEDFRAEHQLMDISHQANQLYTELKELDEKKAEEKIKAQYYEHLLEYIREDKDFTEMHSPSSMGVIDNVLNELVSELTSLYTKRSRVTMTSKEQSPFLKTLDKEIEATKEALRENISNIKRSNEILISDLNQRIENLEQRINMLPSKERNLIGIQRKFNLNEATYNYLMEKRAEAGIALASNIPENEIVDSARNPGIISPNTSRNYLIALVLGFVFPFGVIYLRDFFNTKIQDKKDVTNLVNFPIVGIIPHMRQAARNKSVNLITFEGTKTPASEAFRAMRANLSFIAPDKKSKLVSITSAKSEEGKTFTAINLACVQALAGKKTLIFSSDMRKPRIHNEFNVKKEPGLANYLIGKQNLDDIIQKTEYNENLQIITSGTIPPNPSELLESDKLQKMLEELKSKYDYIITDTPPIGIVPDAFTVLKSSDIIIFIVRQKFSEKGSLEFLNDFVSKTGINNIYIEINDVKMGPSGYGYSYGYGYGYGYGSYYGDDVENEKSQSTILKSITDNLKKYKD